MHQSLMLKLNGFYLNLRRRVWLACIVYLLRMLIGFAFIPSGMKKVLGLRFTQIPVDNPIGFFFEAMYQTGFYWNFLGYGQLLAAFLLMTQRFATIGALLFAMIASNIFVITISLPFKGTWVITGGILFASVCLLLWDYNKLRYLLLPDNFKNSTQFHRIAYCREVMAILGVVTVYCIGIMVNLGRWKGTLAKMRIFAA